MNRAVIFLLTTLAIQCGIIAYAWWPTDTSNQATVQDNFAPFNPEDVDRIAIGDAYDNEMVMSRTGEQWSLPGLHGLPADGDRIGGLLAGLAAGNEGWPIARSETARQRFQVGDGNYQRRLQLSAGDNTAATVFLGTSPGFGKVHARNSEQNAIFSIALNHFELPAVPGMWLDPRILQVRVPVRIDSDLYHLRLEDGNWLAGNGSPPDNAELTTLLTTLKTLTVIGVADEDQVRSLAETEADVIMDIESLAGTITLELIARDGQHFVHSSEYPLFFEIGELDFERIAGIDINLISGAANGP